jgi:RNA polymerase sigma-70 factor (ECF subfamily)
VAAVPAAPGALADADRPLVNAAASGDRDAFTDLVVRHQARVFNLARALVGDDGEAEDVAQEVFIRAFRSLHAFRGDSTFRTWLHRIAVNVARSHLRERARHAGGWWPWRRHDRDRAAVDPEPTHEGFEADVHRRQAIDRALATLPADLRMAVTLRDVEGLGYREIAEALHVPIGTVESRIFRARQRLRPLLEPLVSADRQERNGR